MQETEEGHGEMGWRIAAQKLQTAAQLSRMRELQKGIGGARDKLRERYDNLEGKHAEVSAEPPPQAPAVTAITNCAQYAAEASDAAKSWLENAAKQFGIATNMRSTGRAKKVVDDKWEETEAEIARLEQEMAQRMG